MLERQLAPNWQIKPHKSADNGELVQIDLKSKNGQFSAQFLVVVFRNFQPRDLDTLYGRIGRKIREVGNCQDILVVSNYLSLKSRAALEQDGFSYFDASGNILLAPKDLPIFLKIASNSKPVLIKFQDSLHSTSAIRLMRFLVDVKPPYGVVDIEKATLINRGFISRILKVIYKEGYIERNARGPVKEVDWRSLLLRIAQESPTFDSNEVLKYIARTSLSQLLEKVSNPPLKNSLTITGSFAAYQIAPIAAPSLLVMYSNKLFSQIEIEAELDLLPADDGANVMIVRAKKGNSYSFLKKEAGGLYYATPSQVVTDCLSGYGRMPAEGEALMDWMAKNESIWRFNNVDEFLDEIEKTSDA